ncbi:CerR family C-terminal domain-containing protein [Maritalea porphyrae]|uniref:TetR family transcriptional regulator n=1 Tax=Maritalea porphyrae TaxID=880732 RepID=A0ABQ5UV57_9HYPH|nr:CerR family C-terminal domain-containing protein [Maritalea porphyrae]GLQ18276.1 TetR family transcriptional regulator [Maritalea porphyrae]
MWEEEGTHTRSDKGSNADDNTKNALLQTAISLFSKNGFAATSTREIAKAAKANIGSISYYFGSKEGLRRACARSIASLVAATAARALPDSDALSPDEATEQLSNALGSVIKLMLSHPNSRNMAAFLLQEVSEQGEVLDEIYTHLLEPLHKKLCRLWSVATGDPAEDSQTIMRVFSVLGQALYFRIGEPLVVRRLGWERIGKPEAEQISEMVLQNLQDMIIAARVRNKT